MQKVHIMKATRYMPLFALLVLAACQPGEPEQPDPQAGRTGADTARPADRMPEQPASRAAPATEATPAAAVAEISATEGFETAGTVKFTSGGDTVRVEGRITGLEPGAHGLHIHAKGDCSAPDASSAGDHYSPDDDPHGSPNDLPGEHHLGDLGNVVADEDGSAEIVAEDPEVRLSGPESVIGKAVVVHADRDDLETQPSGDSGARVGCGVIRMTSQSAETGQAIAAAFAGAGHENRD
jgi:Cu-Zn family superoxide dismutase